MHIVPIVQLMERNGWLKAMGCTLEEIKRGMGLKSPSQLVSALNDAGDAPSANKKTSTAVLELWIALGLELGFLVGVFLELAFQTT